MFITEKEPKKNCYLQILITPEEKQQIRKEARKNRLSVSAYARNRLFRESGSSTDIKYIGKINDHMQMMTDKYSDVPGFSGDMDRLNIMTNKFIFGFSAEEGSDDIWH